MAGETTLRARYWGPQIPGDHPVEEMVLQLRGLRVQDCSLQEAPPK